MVSFSARIINSDFSSGLMQRNILKVEISAKRGDIQKKPMTFIYSVQLYVCGHFYRFELTLYQHKPVCKINNVTACGVIFTIIKQCKSRVRISSLT